MKVAEIVKEYRTSHRLSLRDFANECGCSFQYLSKLEKGEIAHPSWEMMMKLSHAMGKPAIYLFEVADDAYAVEEPQSNPGKMEMLYSSYKDADEKIQKAIRVLLGIEK